MIFPLYNSFTLVLCNVFLGNLQVAEEDTERKKQRLVRKITKQRLKNIALYYLQRFETSSENLKAVLLRRVNVYAFQNPDWSKEEAIGWIEEIVTQFEGFGYVNDARFAEMKIKDYLAAGKSVRYIKGKLQLKGIDESMIDSLLEEQNFDEYESALRLAKKKRIGPFRSDEVSRSENRQKDMGTLVRAGFGYDVVQKIIDMDTVY